MDPNDGGGSSSLGNIDKILFFAGVKSLGLNQPRIAHFSKEKKVKKAKKTKKESEVARFDIGRGQKSVTLRTNTPNYVIKSFV